MININSALAAFTNTIFFNICALVICLISIWVEQNNFDNLKFRCAPFNPTSIFVLGFERYEVISLLISSSMTLIESSFVLVAALSRVKEQPVVYTDPFCVFVGFLTHVLTIFIYPDARLNHVVCIVLPCPTFKDINPIFGCNILSTAVVYCSCIVIHFWNLHIIDTAAAFSLVSLTIASMLPLAFYTNNVILQNLSNYMREQLDKCLHEALFVDGVLEFRNEQFWMKSFGKIAGTLEVRIRKNVNEDYVLNNVMRHLSRVITTLTVQKFYETSKTHVDSEYYPMEYYIDELLLQEEYIESRYLLTKESRKEIDPSDSVVLKIDDILSINTFQVEHFIVNKKQYCSRNKSKKQNVVISHSNAFLFKNYLHRKRVMKNALLLNTKLNFDNMFIIKQASK